jgi:hypothetical protein
MDNDDNDDDAALEGEDMPPDAIDGDGDDDDDVVVEVNGDVDDESNFLAYRIYGTQRKSMKGLPLKIVERKYVHLMSTN